MGPADTYPMEGQQGHLSLPEVLRAHKRRAPTEPSYGEPWPGPQSVDLGRAFVQRAPAGPLYSGPSRAFIRRVSDGLSVGGALRLRAPARLSYGGPPAGLTTYIRWARAAEEGGQEGQLPPEPQSWGANITLPPPPRNLERAPRKNCLENARKNITPLRSL